MVCATKDLAPSDFQRMGSGSNSRCWFLAAKDQHGNSSIQEICHSDLCDAVTWKHRWAPLLQRAGKGGATAPPKNRAENMNMDSVTPWGLAEKRSQHLSWVGVGCKCHLTFPTLLCCSIAAFLKGWFMFSFFLTLYPFLLKRPFSACLFACSLPRDPSTKSQAAENKAPAFLSPRRVPGWFMKTEGPVAGVIQSALSQLHKHIWSQIRQLSHGSLIRAVYS